MTNPYLDGLYAPVDDELAVDDLEIIEGALPRELDGMLVQNSPNPRFTPRGHYHWFDGDGMVHGVRFRDGKAGYRNRWIRTRALAEEQAAGQAQWDGIMMPFDPSRAATDKNTADKDTANTDLVWHGGKLLATWWLGGAPYHLSVPDLDTIGPVDFAGTLDCGVAAHPKVDPVTGEMMFFDYSLYRAPYLRYGVVDAGGRVTHRVDVELPGPRLLHDIAITERHTILLDLPMLWDPDKLAQGKRRVRFDRETPARFGVVPRHGGEVRWFESEPCYIYHTINAWEDGDAVVMTCCRIADPLPTKPPEHDRGTPRLTFLRLEPYLARYRFDLKTGETTWEQLDDVPTEFPRMNDARLGRPTRYAWHPRVAREPTLLFDACVKYDTAAGGSQTFAETFEYGRERFGGETVFAPGADTTPARGAEDAGWVVTFVNDRREGTSEVVVLDAADLALVARVRMPRRVPVGFHAHWVPGDAVEEESR